MIKQAFLGLLIILLVNACIKESALSDIEISDPQLLQPDIVLKRTHMADGSLQTTICVQLFDKNYHAVALKKGQITLNGQVLKLENYPITNAPYYSINPTVVSVEPNQTYSFFIELSDGKQYMAAINTQAVDLYELNLPAIHDKSIAMPIDWKGTETENSLEVTFSGSFLHNNESSTSYVSLLPNQQQKAAAAFNISSNYFNQKAGIHKGAVEVSSSKTGTVDNRFRSGSKISSIFSVQAECQIN